MSMCLDSERPGDDESDGLGTLAVKTYVPAGEEGEEARGRLEQGLWHLSQLYPLPRPTFRVLAYEDWANSWRQYFPVLHIGQRLVIRPPWLEYRPRPDELVIELEPGMAFGTGLHPTTQMCLMALEKLLRPGARVLDLGAGSGILSIAAARLGASCVLGLDVDPTAASVARANVAANAVADRVRVEQGSLDHLDAQRWDVIMVNILASTIVNLLNQGLAEYLAPGGALVAAGIVEEQAPKVLRVLGSCGLSLSDRLQEKDWVTLVARA
jgi:ribosomal protein L11 methyltransferase